MSVDRFVGWTARVAPVAVVGALAAFGTMLWEEGRVSPVDGVPQARYLFLIATTLWALTLALSAHLRWRRTPRTPGEARRWTLSRLVVAAATGALVGAGLFATVIAPSGGSHGRWYAYRAAMRSDLREVVEAQEKFVRQNGQPAAEWEQLDLFASDGVVIELRTTQSGWSASARSRAMEASGYPEAECIVFGGDVGVNALHRTPDGRIPAEAGTPLCVWGRYVPRGSRDN